MTALDQQKLGTEFADRPEPADILGDVSLQGATALVTGGYSGIGLETTRALAGAGARVYVPVRDPVKATENLRSLEGDIVTGQMDLADAASVRRFAADVVATEEKLDLLINNAGIMACPETRLGGIEAQFATNHLGHFLLTRELLPLLLAAGGARVVSLSSVGHRRSDVRWDDLNFEHEAYDKWVAYGQSKTANALFALALDLQYRTEGIQAFSVHPGGILTPLQRHLPREEMQALGWLGEDGELSSQARALFKTPSQGCATTLWAATSPALDSLGGLYCEDCDVAELVSDASPSYQHVEAWACSEDSALRLWLLSEKLLG